MPPLAPRKVLKVGAGTSAGEVGRAAQWKAHAEAAMQRGAESARAGKAKQTAQERATAETTRQQEDEVAQAREDEVRLARAWQP